MYFIVKHNVLFILLLFSIKCLNLSAANNSEDLIAQVDSLLKINRVADIELICNTITDSNFKTKNHRKEVEVVRLAIDYLQPEALIIFHKRNIGMYDAAIDSITPIEYFLDENFEKRITGYLYRYGNPDDALLNIWATFHILLAFQPLDDRIIELIKLKMTALQGIINSEESTM